MDDHRRHDIDSMGCGVNDGMVTGTVFRYWDLDLEFVSAFQELLLFLHGNRVRVGVMSTRHLVLQFFSSKRPFRHICRLPR